MGYSKYRRQIDKGTAKGPRWLSTGKLEKITFCFFRVFLAAGTDGSTDTQ